MNLTFYSTISSLNIPALLAIPSSILKQAQEVRTDGGSQALYDMWEQAQKASSRNSEILEDAFNLLDEEHESDESLRSKYNTAWSRPTSQSLTQQFAAQGQRHRHTLASAQKADLIVRNKLDTWANIMDVLTLSPQDLESSIPDDEPNTLKSLVQDMNERVKARKELVDRAKKASNADDISMALLKRAAELTARSPMVKIEAAQFEELFVQELKKYDAFIMAVDKEDEQQSALLKKLNEAFHQYQSAQTGTKRDKALQNLNQAYLKYKEIKTNLTEGLKVGNNR